MFDMCQGIEDNSMVVCTEGVLEHVMAFVPIPRPSPEVRHKGEKQATLDTLFHLLSNFS